MSAVVSIVEILIIGIQAGVGVILWAIGSLGYGVVHKPLSLLDAHGGAWRWLPFIGMVALAACYTQGIFVDRMALFLFHSVIRPIIRCACPGFLRRRIGEAARRVAEEENELVKTLQKEGEVSFFLEDYRSRLRIARATFLNTLLIWSAFWLTPNLSGMLPRYPHAVKFATLVGIVFLAIWVVVLGVLQLSYQERLKQLERIRQGH